MKKFLTFIITAAILFTMASVSVSAAVTYQEAVPTDIGTLIVKKGATTKDITESNGSVINLSENGTSFCPKENCWVRYEFKADKDGTYTFIVDYIGRTNSNRGFDYAIDATDTSKRVFCDIVESADHRYAVITEELTAGTHSFYLFCPTGFDDETLKSCDIYGWSAYFTKEAVKAAAPDITSDAAPDTADTAVIAVVALAISATAAIVISKKH
ncbi:MAG: hypothetical protein IJ493_11210 [Clostridia bacterium]|nr:hypothetical protein [Clostridia bacterium]